MVPLADLTTEIRPGSQDDGWTWRDEARWLWLHQFDDMVQLVRSLLDDGQQEPVMVGDDGRLWDGHHRVVALLAIGEPLVLTESYRDLDEATQMDRLIQAVGDMETREHRRSHSV